MMPVLVLSTHLKVSLCKPDKAAEEPMAVFEAPRLRRNINTSEQFSCDLIILSLWPKEACQVINLESNWFI